MLKNGYIRCGRFPCGALLLAFTLLLLTGCASQLAFREGRELVESGKVLEGLAKVEEATQLEPRNAEYRLFLTTRREAFVNQKLAHADLMREQGQLAEAEKTYRLVESIEPGNKAAKLGVERLALERRHREQVKGADQAFKANDLRGASEIVRTILIENPSQREAKNIESRIIEKQLTMVTTELKLAESFKKPVTLEFRDALIRSIFEVLSKSSGINFVYDRDIRPDLKTTIFVKNTPLDEAIRLICVTSQLETRVLNENSILVYPSNPQKLKDYQPLSVRAFYLTNADAKNVANTLKTILKTKDLVVNEKLNLLIMRDTPDAIRLAEKLVALDDIGEPEVMLEVEILEVKRTRLLNLGIQWPNQLTLSPLAPGVTGLTLSDLKLLRSDTTGATMGNVVFNAQKDDSDVNILANPRIRVKNREKAKIMIGDRVPVITSTSTSTGFVSESINYVDVGLKLEVEPHIFLDDEVSIKVGLEVSSLVREITTKSGSLSYQIGTRNVNTVLRLKDGENQVLAGLINNEDRRTANKIPGLGDIPLLNRLFGSQKDDRQKTEIVLSITPRLIRNVRRPDIQAAEFTTGTESSLGGRPLTLSAPNQKSTGSADKPGAAGPAPAPAKPGQANSQTPAKNAATAVPVPGPAAAADPSSAASSTAEEGSAVFSWQGPSKVRSGEQFSAALRLTSQPAFSGQALMVGYDPQALQLVEIVEGDFMKQGGGQTSFSSRIDPVSGKAFVAIVRQGGSVNGAGSVVMATFKAVKTGTTHLQLLSVTPEPLPTGAVAGTAELSIAVE